MGALIRSPDGYWFRMNDMEVIPVNQKHVLREQGYIVFYRRKTNNLMKCQLQRIKSSKSVSLDNDDNQYEDEEKDDTTNNDEEESSDAFSNNLEDDMDLNFSPCGVSKLSQLSEQKLKILRDQYVDSLEEYRKMAENRRNQTRSNMVQSALDKMKVIQSRIGEIDSLLQIQNIQNNRNNQNVQNHKKLNGTRIDQEFHELNVTTDYFANNCNDPVSGGSMVVVDEVDAMLMEWDL